VVDRLLPGWQERAFRDPDWRAERLLAAAVDARREPVELARERIAQRSERMTGKVVLLSGGNPQIPKGYGDAPVQAYIAAMPDWKREVGHRIDALIGQAVPGVRKAVKWNSPFYGLEDDLWFLSFHVFAKYVKVTFFRGASLDPVPPGKSKHPQVRYLDIREGEFDETQFAEWVRQASELPGEKM
jgi:hypothetical protein